MLADLLAILRCPACGDRFDDSTSQFDAALTCSGCQRSVPVIDGIPRFVVIPEDESARRTQASFGYEWTLFNDWRDSGSTNFSDYFQGLDLLPVREQLVLDAGCGMGRHARQIAPLVGRVVAVDFSRAIDQAARNVRGIGNVDCIQADLMGLPLADAAFDFVYSLGVLHHLEHTERALGVLVQKLRPGGRLRVYLYWKRHGWQGRLLAVVTFMRRLTVRLPFRMLRGLSWLLSVGLFAGVVLPYRVLSACGLRFHATWPLFVYTKYPFVVLYNDQFDRFSAPIEKRYDPDDIKRLLEAAGMRDVQIRPCFGWLADAIKPA
jgi:SAM-dependent methyltransferase